MAEDKLMFPIGFDLDKAVKDAGAEWKSKYAAELEKAIKSRKVSVGVKFDIKDADALDKVKERLKSLKLEPITPETKKAIQDLAKELEALAKALTKINSLTRGGVSSTGPDAVRAKRIEEIETRRLNKAEIDRQRALEIAERRAQKAALAEEKLARARGRSVGGIRSQTAEYGNQLGYIDRLMQRMAVLWSIHAVTNFVSKLREVTAEFELQRVSLGAIIQDQSRANQLFSEIKTFALQSPLTIMDLTKYTKQLAAYKIGTEELFDTTKRLADVSVGLGVSFDRIVLAYGQIRAAGALRASEIRQLTEAGIPIVEALSEKLSEVNGKLVSASDVMGMVEKRMISFEQVKEIFEDMTSAGGMFYNMQEKQAQTLFGMWSKLSDAAAVMYDEMGNTDAMNSAMKGFIGTIESALRNWKLLAGVIGSASIAMAQYAIAQKISQKTATARQNILNGVAAAQERVKQAGIAYNALLKQQAALEATATEAQRKSIAAKIANAKATLNLAIAERKAAQSVTLLGRATNSLKGFFAGNWLTIAIVALGSIASYIYNAYDKAHRLEKALDEIKESGVKEDAKSVYNFERLAKKAVEAADGSKEQKDALDELHRTYKDMIPVQDMTIEKLRSLKGNYESLTAAVKEYIAQRTLENEINAITEEYGKKIVKERTRASKAFGLYYGLDTDQIRVLLDTVEKLSEDSSKSVRDVWIEAFSEVMDVTPAIEKIIENAAKSEGGVYNQLVSLYRERNAKIEEETSTMADATKYVGKYRDEWKKLQEAMAEAAKTNTDDKSFLANQKRTNEQILDMATAIGNAFKEAGATWRKEWSELMYVIDESDPSKISTIDFRNIIKGIDVLDGLDDKAKSQLKDFVIKVQEAYDGLIPSNDIVKGINGVFHEVVNATGTNIDLVQGYLMKGNDNYEKYRKNLKDTLDGIKKDIIAVNVALAAVGILKPEEIERLNAEKERLAELEKFFEALLGKLPDTKKGSSRAGTDQRLQNLQEIVSTLKNINKEYEDLAKKEGATKALSDTAWIYESTFKSISELSKKYKFGLPKFEVPTDAKTLTEYLKKIKDVMARLPKSDKAVLALGVDIDKIDLDAVTKNVEAQLKLLQDRVSRTKTAKEFYDRILNLTGDYEMSAEITMSVYGDTGESLQKDMADHLREMFGSFSVEVPVEIIGDDNKIDYLALRKYVDENREALGDMAKELDKVADEGLKNSEKQWDLWLKDLEKAKSYSDKRIDLARYTAKQIADIEASSAKRERKDELIKDYKSREEKEAAKLDYEAFKDMPMYVQLFDDLDHASTRMLTNMRDKLMAMQGQWKNLDPTQLKELQSRLREIDSQLAKRNPFKVLSDSIKEYKKLRKDGTRKHADEGLKKASDEYEKARKDYNDALKEHGADSEITKNAKELVDQTEEAQKKAEKLVDNWKKVEDAIGLSAGNIFNLLGSFADIAKVAADLTKEFGGSEEDVQFWNDLAEGIGNVTSSLQDMLNAVMSGDIVGIVTSAITAIPKMVIGFSQIFSAGKIKRANKEIKKQQKFIDELSYSYERLQAAIDKALGSDYIRNLKQQRDILQKQAEAYRKQADAERGKGKKADKDSIKGFEDAAQQIEDTLKDTKDDIKDWLAGTDITSAAREFAKSWLDAKLSFEDTTKAMEDKFAEMVENMIVEAMAAEIMQRTLKPFYDFLDEAASDGTLSTKEIVDAANLAFEKAGEASQAMEIFYNALEDAGFNWSKLMQDADGQLTGISRDIATASEESINGLAQGITTQNFYISQIHANVQTIAQIMMQGYNPAVTADAISLTDLVTMQNQHLANLPQIAANTAAMVDECRRAANTCENIASQLGRVIKPKGTSSTFAVSTAYA